MYPVLNDFTVLVCFQNRGVLSNNFNFDFVSMLGRIVGVLFIPLVITAVISGLSKQNRDFGKLMACITAITCVIALFGHFINKP